MDATEASDNVEGSSEIPGGKFVAVVLAAAWIAVAALYLDHRVVLSSDSMNNYVHVWWIARDLWHHGRLPWRMPVLGHGDAYAYPYGFTNWTAAALLWPLAGNWAVTLCTLGGAVGCIVATFVAFPELRTGWWTAAVLANPAIIESLLFGQQAFAWGAALLLFGIACWRRGRRLSAALLVGLGQATHAPIVLPIGILVVLVCLRYVSDRRALLRYYAISLVITIPGALLVFASPGYADSSTRDRLVNFVGTLAPRLLLVAFPFMFVWLRRTGIRALAPLAVAAMLVTNIGLEEPLNVTFQWRALTRSQDADTTSLDNFLRSAQFEPGATYRVLRGSSDGKLGLYDVLLAGGRLDSEMFPESMAMYNFTAASYEQLLCARHVDFVIAYDSYTTSRRTNELALLARLAANSPSRNANVPAVRVRPIERAADHVVYQITRTGCPTGSSGSS
ncbi:MAG: hypothetical protein ACLPVY_05270 [Acidimicrobiia bacterium]